MSILSDIMADTLAVIAELKGDVVEYGPAAAGPWVSLPGFVMHPAQVQPRSHDDTAGMEIQEEGNIAKGPLTPALVVGQFLRDVTNGNRVWCVEGVMTDLQQIITLRRVSQGRRTPGRGGDK